MMLETPVVSYSRVTSLFDGSTCFSVFSEGHPWMCLMRFSSKWAARVGVKEPGSSAWVWLVLLEGTWGKATPDMFDPVHRISWLVEQDKWFTVCGQCKENPTTFWCLVTVTVNDPVLSIYYLRVTELKMMRSSKALWLYLDRHLSETKQCVEVIFWRCLPSLLESSGVLWTLLCALRKGDWSLFTWRHTAL